jgi:GNAT superfamily N-acetyltransferase
MGPVPGVVIATVPVEATYPLRHEVLRPGVAPEDLVLAGDGTPGSVSFAASTPGGEIVGTASLCVEAPPFTVGELPGPDLAVWRLRAMATKGTQRKRGVGAAVLAAAIEHVSERGGGFLWCSARITAQGFYERAGFVAEGGIFEVAGIGPHVMMWRLVRATPAEVPTVSRT